MSSHDVEWASTLLGVEVSKEDRGNVLTPDAFLDKCLSRSGAAKGYIRFDFSSQQLIVPELTTVAAVLDAVPLEADPQSPDLPLLLDVSTAWKGFSALDASEYVYRMYINGNNWISKDKSRAGYTSSSH